MSTLRVDPAELHAAVRQAYAAAQEVSPLVRAIEQALTDSFVRSDEAAQYAQSAGCPWTRGVARVLDAPSSTKGFDKVGAWVRADGSPWSGWDAQLEVVPFLPKGWIRQCLWWNHLQIVQIPIL